jgi:hypothetical protein
VAAPCRPVPETRPFRVAPGTNEPNPGRNVPEVHNVIPLIALGYFLMHGVVLQSRESAPAIRPDRRCFT